MPAPVFVLGGAQSDFAVNAMRQQQTLFDLMATTVSQGLASARLEPDEVEVAHVGNFAAELFCGQWLLGGFFASIDPAFAGLPTARHEAACASSSVAALAAAAEIEAGRYDLACVVGIEMMRNVPGEVTTRHLGTAAWQGREFQDAKYVWPRAFSDLGDEYDRRYGLAYAHLGRIAEINYENGRRNPNAHTRRWTFEARSFTEDDEANPVIEGRIRRQECGQVSDGAAVVFLASEAFARRHAERIGRRLDDTPLIRGWGHRTSPMHSAEKLRASRAKPYVYPHVRGTIEDAFRRAGIAGVEQIDGIETHDCFAVTEYMAIDHFGITAPGEAWKAIEAGDIERGGRIPVNPSGGLIGAGHPVGATGARMLLDACKQISGTAGDYQVEGARTFATLNIGGAATTTVSFVVGLPQ
jgi:acetyl-CoA C-acetyltransferase